MSLGDGRSSYNEARDSRTRVNNMVFTGSHNSTTEKKFCNVCQVALRLKEIDGLNKLWCSSCGNSIPVDPGNVETANDSKYTSRYGSTDKSNFFIISQNKKKKTQDEIEKEEARRELGGRDGLSVTESREYTYDSQGGWS